MRSLGMSAVALALSLALASVAFVGLARSTAWSEATCTVAAGLCERPSLLIIPVLATLLWGLLLAKSE
jgi:hypothetical protein